MLLGFFEGRRLGADDVGGGDVVRTTWYGNGRESRDPPFELSRSEGIEAPLCGADFFLNVLITVNVSTQASSFTG
jgi:hypothetical protein